MHVPLRHGNGSCRIPSPIQRKRSNSGTHHQGRDECIQLSVFCVCRRRTRAISDSEDRVELVGKRVGMMGTVWPGEDPNVKFYGLVTKKMKFKDRKQG